ncbi:MAG TPA: hypothetical protein VER17_15765 [Tepidisphaeraceae bacterium]|nr:hypothetical protein [Tepidisphaeraceae bacterium]
MTADTCREILKRAPFQPFRVVMSSGESYNVMHPETALVSAQALILALPDPTQREGERLAFCSYLQIAHVETLKPSRARVGASSARRDSRDALDRESRRGGYFPFTRSIWAPTALSLRSIFS